MHHDPVGTKQPLTHIAGRVVGHGRFPSEWVGRVQDLVAGIAQKHRLLAERVNLFDRETGRIEPIGRAMASRVNHCSRGHGPAGKTIAGLDVLPRLFGGTDSTRKLHA